MNQDMFFETNASFLEQNESKTMKGVAVPCDLFQCIWSSIGCIAGSQWIQNKRNTNTWNIKYVSQHDQNPDHYDPG